jgi:hypothetical protein
MWTIHDRFIPIQEGWMQYYSLMTQKGLLPYRDFYYFTQPIPLFIAQFISKFGDSYILYRYYGMMERSILILSLYFLIAKHFSPTATFLAVITSAFLYQSFNIDLLYTYYQTTLLFFFLSLIFLQRGTGSQYEWLFDCLVGIFASLAFFTKQSSGLFVSIFLLFTMVWYTPRKFIAQRALRFLLGWVIPASIIFGWLKENHIFSEYLSQVFGGTSSKGSVLNILFGFWTRHFALQYLDLFLVSLLILYFFSNHKKLQIRIESQYSAQVYHFNKLWLFALPLFILGGRLILPDKNASVGSIIGELYLLLWLYFSFYFMTIATLVIGIKWISRRQLPFSTQLSELILASFAWTYSTGLSGQLEFYATLLGTALVLAFLFDRVQLNWKYFRLFLFTASCLVLFFCAVKKNQLHYDWWGWAEYGHIENANSVIPAFKGFKLSSGTAEIYDRIYLDIVKNTTSNDYVFTYPFMALFNYVTDRRQPTFSPVHYFDVCPDYIATMDAANLKENPPKMIIYMEVPEPAYKIHELIFRNRQPSGQRNIDHAIEEIVINYNYKKIDSFVSPKWNWPIYVWLKP